jgi:hypothetical protein
MICVDQDLDVGRRTGRDRQHALGKVVGEPLAEDPVADLVEQRHAGARVEVEQPLAEVGDPVLLVVTARRRRPRRPSRCPTASRSRGTRPG